MPAFGADVDIEAIDALLFCIRREAGREAWLRLRLQLLDPEEIEAIADPAGVCAELHRLEAQSHRCHRHKERNVTTPWARLTDLVSCV
jgi:hypothetical protein